MEVSPGLVEIVKKISHNRPCRSNRRRRTLKNAANEFRFRHWKWKHIRNRYNTERPRGLDRSWSRVEEWWRICEDEWHGDWESRSWRSGKVVSEEVLMVSETEMGGGGVAAELSPPFSFLSVSPCSVFFCQPSSNFYN